MLQLFEWHCQSSTTTLDYLYCSDATTTNTYSDIHTVRDWDYWEYVAERSRLLELWKQKLLKRANRMNRIHDGINLKNANARIKYIMNKGKTRFQYTPRNIGM